MSSVRFGVDAGSGFGIRGVLVHLEWAAENVCRMRNARAKAIVQPGRELHVNHRFSTAAAPDAHNLP
jgi:hypothetical protein